MSRRDTQVLGAFFALGWHRARSEHATTVGRVLLLALILVIFWAMWQATPLAELSGAERLTVDQLLWYLAATEAVTMSVGLPYRIVEADVQSGELASSFVRPVSYVLATFANWVGEMTYRFLVVLAAAVIVAAWATRSFPVGPLAGIAIVIGLWLGCVMLLLSQLAIGLLATWMKSAAPAFWIWQKLFFILGGLMIPLTFYPAWLATASRATPFAAMLFLPASLTFDASATNIAVLFVSQTVWIVILTLLAWALYARVETHLRIHGG
jgi:ABC-2 type transport system permease protein